MIKEVECKVYTSKSSKEEIVAIKRRVYLYKDRIIMYREMPLLSDFQMKLYSESLSEIVDFKRQYSIVIDLSETINRPSAKSRAKLRELFAPFKNNIKQAAVFTGKNPFLNIAARFVLSGVGIKKLSFHSSAEKAIDHVKNS